MKNLSSPLTNEEHYSNPMLEQSISEKHARYQEDAILCGKTCPQNSASIAVHLDAIRAGYQGLLSESNQKLKPYFEVQTGTAEKETAKKKITESEEEGQKKEAEKRIAQHSIETMPDHGSVTLFLIGLLMSACILSGEWIYTAKSLQMLTQSFLTALWIGLGLCVGLFSLSFFGLIKINRIHSPNIRRLAIAGLIIVIGGTFIFLGFLRSSFFKALYNEEVSPWGFILLNIVLFLGALFISESMVASEIHKLKDGWKQHKTKRKINKLSNSIETYKKNVREIEAELEATLTKRLSKISYAKNMEQLIKSRYESSILSFKKAFCQRGGIIPDNFNSHIPSLKFFTTDINI